jgi:hypothetical protein
LLLHPAPTSPLPGARVSEDPGDSADAAQPRALRLRPPQHLPRQVKDTQLRTHTATTSRTTANFIQHPHTEAFRDSWQRIFFSSVCAALAFPSGGSAASFFRCRRPLVKPPLSGGGRGRGVAKGRSGRRRLPELNPRGAALPTDPAASRPLRRQGYPPPHTFEHALSPWLETLDPRLKARVHALSSFMTRVCLRLRVFAGVMHVVASAHALCPPFSSSRVSTPPRGGRFKLAPHFEEAEFAHMLLPRNGVVSSFVVLHEKTGEVRSRADGAKVSSALFLRERPLLRLSLLPSVASSLTSLISLPLFLVPPVQR